MWHFRTSFWYFMQPAAYLGIAAGVVSLVALFWWPSMGNSARIMALIGLAAVTVGLIAARSTHATPISQSISSQGISK